MALQWHLSLSGRPDLLCEQVCGVKLTARQYVHVDGHRDHWRRVAESMAHHMHRDTS
jgi:hypothetical protein